MSVDNCAELDTKVFSNSVSAVVTLVEKLALGAVNEPDISEDICAELDNAPLKIPLKLFAVMLALELISPLAVMWPFEPDTKTSPSMCKSAVGVPTPNIPILFVEASVLNKGLLELPLIVKSTLLAPSLNVISCGADVESFKSIYDIPPILNLSLSPVKLR